VTPVPSATLPPQGSVHAHDPTAHAAFVYVPERTPLSHVRLWEIAAQVFPHVTEAAE
jgi:hypothetical protein